MFDIGFSELLLIGIVALVVFGPEELPRVARTAGLLLGRLRRYVADVKSDISREIEASEMKSLVAEVQDSARSLQQTLNTQAAALQADFDALAKPLEDVRSGLEAEAASVRQSALEPELPAVPGDAGPALAEPPATTADAPPVLDAPEPAPALPQALPADFFAPPAPARTPPEEAGTPAADDGQLDLFGRPVEPSHARKE
ncbi:MAG: Sec-independent protein translocase protein TatB [Candidatus Dactylopiibacterium sp.]|nr:Sec-independent protein translocase protein TatB [Candidatus Dactylopiibacterium sp.]